MVADIMLKIETGYAIGFNFYPVRCPVIGSVCTTVLVDSNGEVAIENTYCAYGKEILLTGLSFIGR